MINYGSAKDWQWDGGREVVQFTAYRNGEPIICRVSKECIVDNCGNPDTPEAILDAAKQHFDQITDKIGHLIGLGRFFEEVQPRKIVLLKTADW